jgi:hypothetical protein
MKKFSRILTRTESPTLAPLEKKRGSWQKNQARDTFLIETFVRFEILKLAKVSR